MSIGFWIFGKFPVIFQNTRQKKKPFWTMWLRTMGQTSPAADVSVSDHRCVVHGLEVDPSPRPLLAKKLKLSASVTMWSQQDQKVPEVEPGCYCTSVGPWVISCFCRNRYFLNFLSIQSTKTNLGQILCLVLTGLILDTLVETWSFVSKLPVEPPHAKLG